eukprot:885799-Rhodomonas_salina.1
MPSREGREVLMVPMLISSNSSGEGGEGEPCTAGMTQVGDEQQPVQLKDSKGSVNSSLHWDSISNERLTMGVPVRARFPTGPGHVWNLY